MREIKFRAWIKQWQKISKMHCIDWILGEIFIDSDLHCYSFKIDEVNLMQYTGLKDCKGVEIYEGDIIRVLIPARNRIVKFENGRFCFKDNSRFGDFNQDLSSWLIDDYKIEVIGNAYENSELLGGKK